MCRRLDPSSELLDPLVLALTDSNTGLGGVTLGLAGGLKIFTPQGLLVIIDIG